MSIDWTLLPKKHIDNFCEVMNTSRDKIEKLYKNPGRSANNTSFVFEVDGKAYLYRVPGQGTDLFCFREREKEAYEILSKYNITDKVVYIDANSGVKITEFYENSHIPRFDNKEELMASMKAIKKLHKLNLDFPVVDTLFDRFKRYREYVENVNGTQYYLDGYEFFYDEVLKLQKEINTESDISYCLTHGDASINNLLVTTLYDYPLLIDLEFPAKSDPFDDIATFCVDADFRTDNILLMTEYYLGRKPNKKEGKHALVLCLAGALMWYSWASYKCAVEENNKLFIDFRDSYQDYLEEVYKGLQDYISK